MVLKKNAEESDFSPINRQEYWVDPEQLNIIPLGQVGFWQSFAFRMDLF
jgi:hypothetical protein